MIEQQQKTTLPIHGVIGCLSFFNADNLEIMRGFKDKEFDLAIVDPPYGIGIHKMNYTQSTKGGVAKRRDYSSVTDWDSEMPTKEYFDELQRISKNQIVWGGNYFTEILPPTKGWILWDKRTEQKYNNDFADGEMAWTSFDKPLRIYRYLWSGMLQGNMKDKQQRIHPTEKPVELYSWLIHTYANEGDKIFDSYLGSGSIAIAVEKANRLDKMNLQFVGIEIDKEYYEKALNRIEQYCRQGTLSF